MRGLRMDLGELARGCALAVLVAGLGLGCGSSDDTTDGSDPGGGGGGGAPQPTASCDDLAEVGSGPYAGRTYRVCGPGGVTRALPLVIGLHGGSREALSLFDESGGRRMIELGQREGFITLFPNGSCPDGLECILEERYFWNDCRADRSQPVSADDLGYLVELVERVLPERGFRIDRRNVFVWGISNGGFMALRVAEERPGLVRAVASLNAGEPASNQCAVGAGARPSVLFVRGTEDPWIPFGGGDITPGLIAEDGRVRSMQETLDIWTDRNGCAPGPTSTTPLPDPDPDDGPLGTSSTVTRVDYGGCDDGTLVSLLRVDGGGHTVPSHTPAPSPCFNEFPGLGCTNQDIDGPEAVWDFFRQAAR